MTSKASVLVVDGDDSVPAPVRAALLAAGYEVAAALDGVAALALLGSSRSQVILLDLDLETALMDACSFGRAYRQLPAPHAPLVVITASHDATAGALPIGTTKVLLEPLDVDELLELIAHQATA